MSDTPQPEPQQLPLFFKSVVPIDTVRHADLRLNRNVPPRHAAHTNSVPLGLSELGLAAQFYPIAFTPDANTVPVAILGCQADENLFVDAQGLWRANHYIPAYIRAYPFILIEDQQKNMSALAVDLEATSINRELGDRFVEDGKPSPMLQELFAFCRAVREDMRRASSFGQALLKAGMLEDQQVTLNFKSGGTANLQGFKLIMQPKFDALDDKTFLAWRRDSWVGAVYGQLASIGRWSTIIELADAARAKSSAPD